MNSSPSPSVPPSKDEALRGLVAIFGLALIVACVSCFSWRVAMGLAGCMLFAWAFVTSGKARKPESKKAEG